MQQSALRLGTLFLLQCLLTSCSTQYHSVNTPFLGWTGGYWDAEGPGNLVEIGFNGNALVTTRKVEYWAMRRAAEVCQQNKKTYFVIYPSLENAVADDPVEVVSASKTMGRASTSFYILMDDMPSQYALKASDVLARYQE